MCAGLSDKLMPQEKQQRPPCARWALCFVAVSLGAASAWPAAESGQPHLLSHEVQFLEHGGLRQTSLQQLPLVREQAHPELLKLAVREAHRALQDATAGLVGGSGLGGQLQQHGRARRGRHLRGLGFEGS